MGMTDAIYNVDTTALFYARPTPDVDALIENLNAKLANEPGCYITMSPLSHDDWWLLSCTHFHIMIAFSNEPAPAINFTKALTSPINRLNRFDYGHVVQGHRAFLNIEIGDGKAPLPPEARQIMQEFGSVTNCDPALKMKVLHWTSQFIAAHEGFLALHMGPSQRLFSPEELAKAAGEDFPTSLLMHPIPTMPEMDDKGREGYELALHNSRHLPGPAPQLEGIPRSVPLGTCVSLLMTLFKAHRAGKIALDHGDVLNPSPKWSLYVRHAAADDGAPNGRIILSFYDDRGHDAAAPKITPRSEAPTAASTASDIAPAPAKSLGRALLEKARKAKPAKADAQDPQPAQPTAMIDLQPVQPQQPEPQHMPMKHDVLPDPAEVAERRGIMGWAASKFTSTPVETRVRTATLALILGISTLSNPYAGFTGGLAIAETIPQAADIETADMEQAGTFLVTAFYN